MLGLANPGISSGLSFGRSRSQITFEKFCEKKIIAKKKNIQQWEQGGYSWWKLQLTYHLQHTSNVLIYFCIIVPKT